MVGRFGWSTIFVAMGTREGLAVISFAILGRSVVVLYYSHSLPGLRRHCATRCLLSPAGQQIPPIPNPHGMAWQQTSRPPTRIRIATLPLCSYKFFCAPSLVCCPSSHYYWAEENLSIFRTRPPPRSSSNPTNYRLISVRRVPKWI